MSEEVKRWDLRIVNRYAGDGTGEIETDATMKAGPHGRYVLHSDYDALLAERDRLREALKYYADGEHFCLANEDAWDTVSGEPMNILHHDDGFGESEGYVEDGSIARAALQGARP